MDKQLNAAEQGKLWATYMGNTMSICVLNYFLHHVEDQDIKKIIEYALGMSKQFVQTITDIFNQEGYPIPTGFSEDDVNLQAPRLFNDDFYLHYLKYTGKAGINLYGIAIPYMVRADTRNLITQCVDLTTKLLNQVNETLIAKGLILEAPIIPYPEQVDFVKKQKYLTGFFGDVRPLNALEIAHLHDNALNNATSKVVLIGFHQTSQSEQTKAYFARGIALADKHLDICTKMLEDENLSSVPLLDPLVTTSTTAPFSDKLMMFHKVDMFIMRLRTYGNALAFASRHDIAAKYGKFMLEVGNYVEDGANILIDNGWLEQIPQAADREALASIR
ncbi:uncharacterized protein DUF3231 [Paenibacillus cellulosilyticus]|uniref:Uncharacterized protein DUF3231 n=1 Tax=Paenibacillus cellulosilyticus TaxID=375489 RepID=A0A2V2YXD2_9BACL|nr:DUF3231 family protein [Paenibacillus cellulosilyticus]PWW02820.1 uncharacterized protein DUF3231 [Paenibacillus cellulosilyticus]